MGITLLRTAAAIALLLAQVGAILHARRVDSRYFCWAPYDTSTAYTLRVNLPDGRRLSASEIRRRYRLAVTAGKDDATLAGGNDQRSPQHVKDIIEQYERTYGRNDRAEVVMRFTINGARPAEWRWPS